MNYLIIDTEYPIDRHKLDREIVAIGCKSERRLFAIHQQDVGFEDFFPVYMYKEFEQKGSEKLNYDLLIGHNIKADLLKLWHKEQLQEWFKYGGKIWDTSLAHYILSGQQEKYPELRDIAVRCYGCKQREKKMEQYWFNKNGIIDPNGYLGYEKLWAAELNKSGMNALDFQKYMKKEYGLKIILGPISTENIPKEIVLEDVKNDVIDTELVYLQQVKKAVDKEMLKLIELHMDFLLATCEIEYNGMYIDKNILQANKVKVTAKLEEKTKEFLELIKPYWRSE